jgi:hypothetical protein
VPWPRHTPSLSYAEPLIPEGAELNVRIFGNERIGLIECDHREVAVVEFGVEIGRMLQGPLV